MEIKWPIWIIFFLIPLGSIAQKKIVFVDLDVKTYELYEEAQWKELAELGQKGLDAGIDYYYLRMRLGIAKFNLKRYQSALTHFRKALEFNESDPLALEYLYYSLLWSGRQQEARLIVMEMPKATREKIGDPGKSSLTGVFLEGGLVAINGMDSLISYQPEGPMVDHYLLKNYSYVAGGLDLNFGKRLAVKVGLNQMKFSALQEVLLVSSFGTQLYDSVYQNSQLGVYIGGELTLKPNLYIGLASHFIKGDYNYMEYRAAPMGMDQFTQESFVYKDYVVEGAIKYRFRTVLAGFSASYFDLGNQPGVQTGLDLTWYPVGNLNLYFQAHADRVMPMDTNEDEGSWVWQGMAGVKFFSHLWLEAHVAAGEMAGWSEKSAYIVYNNQDPILLRSGLNLIVPDIVQGLSLTFRYQLQQREHSWGIYEGDDLLRTETKNYLSNSFIGGLTWKL